ncbi:unnamed protein product [Moneuplotes crassus]|uniref:ATP-dependent helicase C-terminal domain-containing protein n=1 Tax=Euplotes crassus TaxID=5936 RepID=A0AAD1U9J5_EUPCR|nr:unnamed protein product [Moneuplotes crassus]
MPCARSQIPHSNLCTALYGQVSASDINVLTKGKPKNMSLDFSWKNRFNKEMFIELGETIIDIIKCVPGGVILTIPSLPLFGQLNKAWEKANVFGRINKIKELFREVGDREVNTKIIERYEYYNEKAATPGNVEKSGACFLTICRNKKFPDYKFSPQSSRLLILVCIPFDNRTEFKVGMKLRKLSILHNLENDELNENLWYREEASRVVNSVINLAVNNKDDYGSVLLIDKRYEYKDQTEDRYHWAQNMKKYDKLPDDLQYSECKQNIEEFFTNMASKHPYTPRILKTPTKLQNASKSSTAQPKSTFLKSFFTKRHKQGPPSPQKLNPKPRKTVPQQPSIKSFFKPLPSRDSDEEVSIPDRNKPLKDAPKNAENPNKNG